MDPSISPRVCMSVCVYDYLFITLAYLTQHFDTFVRKYSKSVKSVKFKLEPCHVKELAEILMQIIC